MWSLRLDTRSLAIFRIGLGTLLLWDLFDRSRALSLHYSDLGVFPRPQNLSAFDAITHWSLHSISGSVEFQAGLFILAGIAALALLIGYKTRTATVACWILMTSLQHRNPFVNFGADEVLRLCLFWGIFLPLGKAFSVDQKAGTAQTIQSPASALLVAQVIAIFFFAGAHKLTDPAWTTGHALSLALAAHPGWLADYLLQAKNLLPLATYSAIGIQLSAPLALLAPLRKWIVSLFIFLQIAMALMMDLGLFPYICIVAWLALFPTTSGMTVGRQRLWVYAIFAGVALPVTGLFERALPSAVPLVLKTVGVHQNWRFFTPAPKKAHWLKVIGRNQNGPWIELIRPYEKLDLRRPPLGFGWARVRWSSLSNALFQRPDLAFNLARAGCRIAAGRLTKVQILTIHQNLLADGENEPKPYLHIERDCR